MKRWYYVNQILAILMNLDKEEILIPKVMKILNKEIKTITKEKTL